MFRIFSTNIVLFATMIVLMLGLTASATERISLYDTLSEADKERIDALARAGELNQWNIPDFMGRLAREDRYDPDRIDKALKADVANRARRDLIHLHKFIQDPRVGLPWIYLLVLVVVPIFVVYVRHCARRRSI